VFSNVFWFVVWPNEYGLSSYCILLLDVHGPSFLLLWKVLSFN
jgi:hypothetical protein